jgi:hypothetical protein
MKRIQSGLLSRPTEEIAMAIWLEDIQQALINLGGVAHYKHIYAETRRIRPEPHPPTFEDIVRDSIQSHSSDSDRFHNKGHGPEKDLFYSVSGKGGGVWGVRSMLPVTPHASDLHASEAEATQRVRYEVYRVIRDTEVVKRLKRMPNHRCQLCGSFIRLSDGRLYSEGHHIKPLGGRHAEPDVEQNILILCPHHHAICDYFATRLDLGAIRLHPEHRVSSDFIEYHNSEYDRLWIPPTSDER